MSTSISDIAGKAYAEFERRTRDDDSSYIVLKDSAPDWLHDLVRSAHGEFLPDDWRYASIRAALGAIHDAGADDPDDLDDLDHEFADGNVDTYNAARFAWLASNLNRAAYCDDAAEEFGYDAERGIVHLIALGQYAESMEVFQSVVESLRERFAEFDDES